MGERLFYTEDVGGSIPSLGTNYAGVAPTAEHWVSTPGVSVRIRVSAPISRNMEKPISACAWVERFESFREIDN